MSKKSKAQAQATRNRILDAAERVFQAKGVSHTTLHEVAQSAGVTRGAVYWHFKNKVDLFNQMHERVHLPIESLADDLARSEEPDPLGRLQALCVIVLQETVRNPHQRRVLDVLFHRCELIEDMGGLVERQQQIYRNALKRSARSFRNAVELGMLPDNLDCDRAAVALSAYVRGIVNSWLLLPEAFNMESEAEALVTAYFDMLKLSEALRSERCLTPA